jgi:hypothetical protein
MKQTIYLPVFLLLFSCNTDAPQDSSRDIHITVEDTIPARQAEAVDEEPDPVWPSKYANPRFRGVTVERTGEHTFRVRGQAQVFEATFSWVVEDGHEQLQKGFEMTDAGAPEWGNFDFKISVSKKRPNSTLTLILFEASAMDGSPQHELPLTLPEM